MPNWWLFDVKKFFLAKAFWYLGVGEEPLRKMFNEVSNRDPENHKEFIEWVRN